MQGLRHLGTKLAWGMPVLSGLILSLAFPSPGLFPLAYIALVPWWLSESFYVQSKGRFLRGFLAGFTFWILSIYWLSYVTFGGMLALAAYCAIYFGIAGICFSRSFRKRHLGLGECIYVAFIWVGLEFIRSTFLTGFPWNTLAISQYRWTSLIQVASFTGVYGISFMVVLVNMALVVYLKRVWGRKTLKSVRMIHELLFSLGLIGALHVWGKQQVLSDNPGTTLRYAVTQINVPQQQKWDQEYVDTIFRRLGQQTAEAHVEKNPELIIWPEACLPDFVLHGRYSRYFVSNLCERTQTPILVGSMDYEPDYVSEPEIYYNSSILFEPGGTWSKYDKRHLVLLGEYIPFEPLIGDLLVAMTPVEGSFVHGTTPGVLSLNQNVRIGPLICFEDVFPYLARETVKAGAHLLVNQTNDGWFDPSDASMQHMAHAVFRCVENSVPMVRCANTGISCQIGPHGNLQSILEIDGRNDMVQGNFYGTVSIPDVIVPTVYSRYGDWFAWLGLLVLIWDQVLYGFRKRKEG